MIGNVGYMSDPEMATWWASDSLTKDERLEWGICCRTGMVRESLAATVPTEFRDEWLTPAEGTTFRLHDDLAAFLNANS